MKTLTKSRAQAARPPAPPAPANGARRLTARDLADPALKQLLKEAVGEMLEANPRLLQAAVEDAWEDTPEAQAAFVRWIKEGESSKRVSEKEVFDILREGR